MERKKKFFRSSSVFCGKRMYAQAVSAKKMDYAGKNYKLYDYTSFFVRFDRGHYGVTHFKPLLDSVTLSCALKYKG